MKPPASRLSFAAVCEELDRRRHITLGLDRMEQLLSVLGNPERRLQTVQVVGTNGKGTTSVALAAALEVAGHTSGAYLSPHVLSYTERVMVRGRRVSEGEFASGMGEVIRTADEHGIPASQFELLTAGAIKMFADAGLSCAVLEAGMGARYDATTAAESEIVVLTNVGLDHTEYLGETVEEIAIEKLASLETGSTLILGTRDPEVVGISRRECARVGAELVEIEVPEEPGTAFEGFAPYAAHDTIVGIRAAEAVLDEKLDAGAWEQMGRRIRGVLPGRFEAHEFRGVPVVVDGGHNLPGLEAALAGVKHVYGGKPLAVVFGCLRDKDIGSMLAALKNEACSLVLTQPENERAADPTWIDREYVPRDLRGRRARVIEDVGEALIVAAEEMVPMGGVVLVTGSLYTAAGVLETLREV
ncbi:MAG: bifunctional folylpolyglutamate synthase/dihydrofolate synthase [Rubrobacteraceae bacterium]